ncbi:hypothetical protein F0562_015903 [Nyssa sinensis]|uniref:Uncharacterized protein n=1 Tax=Nyssa sinensis TaxID=561372 RepID=A0A5J4ZKA4_9ASTE|nr:hypothetical protein F0562_015903 [Nyssa sinensis]
MISREKLQKKNWLVDEEDDLVWHVATCGGLSPLKYSSSTSSLPFLSEKVAKYGETKLGFRTSEDKIRSTGGDSSGNNGGNEVADVK